MARVGAFTQEVATQDTTHDVVGHGNELINTSNQLIQRERLVLCLDQSGSMSSSVDYTAPEPKSKLQATKDAVLTMMANSNELKTHYGVVSFGSSARVVAGISGMYDAMAPMVASINTSGSTNMHDGIRLALALKPNRVVLLSDGHPDSSDGATAQAYRAKELGIKIDTISVGDANDELMMEIARITGGQWSRVSDVESMKQAFLRLETTRYLLEHKPTD